MRPQILFPLFKPLSSLKGIGPRLLPLYERLCGQHAVDLLWHLPVGVIDRTYSPPLEKAEKDRIATLTIKPAEYVEPKRRGLPTRIIAECGEEQISLNFFNVKGDYLKQQFPIGKQVVVSGLLEMYHGQWCMNHPDYIVPIDKRESIPRYQPVYPLTQGISSKILGKMVQQALALAPELPEWLDAHLKKREAWPDWRSAITVLHNPDPSNASAPAKLCRRRLAYDELLADQLALAVIRKHHRAIKGRAQPGTGALQNKLLAILPFQLTSGQRQTVAEISADMTAHKRMLRLLQGDVGSGKTIVALIAMLQAVESGTQAALMVPTEILAKQHHARLTKFLEPLGIEVGLLLGRSRGSGRTDALQKLKDGTLKIVIGTHALFQNDVEFNDLGLAVIDEQHRFGVDQRLSLSDKGQGVDILVMTATPIPRTLTLTAYGDMDVSRLTEKPAGRQPIDTRLVDLARLDEVVAGIERQVKAGRQVYWVCPLVGESEESDLAAATERMKMLSPLFANGAVGLVHGRMKADEKDKTMAAFAAGQMKILVATTVIEVGVDVPNATIMVIEHAERFGLAQLHQLRGRVGRGAEKSTCLLLYQSPLGETAKARLTMVRETEDGFRLAEEDLRLRGPGEMLGKRQSGAVDFRLADLSQDADLLAMASDDAKLILAKDEELQAERGKALRTLLYLFNKDAAVPLLRAG